MMMVSTEGTSTSAPWYLSLGAPVSNKVRLSQMPHEWCLLWTTSSSSADNNDTTESRGVTNSSFVIQSVNRKVVLCCDIEGQLSTRDVKDLKDHPGYTWEFDYQDISGMSVQIVNSSYLKRLSIQIMENDVPPVCTTTALIKGDAKVDTAHAKWNLRFLSGEILFLSNPVIDKRLRCNPMGKLSFDDNWKGWEVFRFIEVGNGELQIVSWTHEKVLVSDAHGTVSTTNNREDKDTRWVVSKHLNNGVLIKSVEHDRYLCAISETELGTVDGKGFAFAAVEWEMEPANSRVFFLAATNDFLLSTRRNGTVCTSKRAKEWEEWKIEKVVNDFDDYDTTGGNVFSIFSRKHGTYLSSTNDGHVCTSTELGENEYWELEDSTEEAGFIIVSYLYNDRQLYCNEEGELATSSIDCQAWRLKPRMPGSLSLNQIVLGSIAAASVIPLMAVPPLWGPAAGLRVVGPALAAAAVEAGPAVAVGSSAAVAASAAVVTTSAVIIAVDQKKRSEKENSQKNQQPIQSIHRPLAAWRSW